MFRCCCGELFCMLQKREDLLKPDSLREGERIAMLAEKPVEKKREKRRGLKRGTNA